MMSVRTRKLFQLTDCTVSVLHKRIESTLQFSREVVHKDCHVCLPIPYLPSSLHTLLSYRLLTTSINSLDNTASFGKNALKTHTAIIAGHMSQVLLFTW